MCGISGWLLKGQLAETALQQMTNALAHRGPDAAGLWTDPEAGIGLGHRRLSILDLSTAANQPFFSQDGRYVMVFNGEVYNYRQIGAELGVPLRTTSDTEVVLEAFAKWGPEAAQRFNGMFALAIWDRHTRSLFLLRDRLGIKPLYLHLLPGGGLAFASELNALKEGVALAGHQLRRNHQAIAAFLHLGYIPDHLSVWEQVAQLPAGHYAILQNGAFTVRPFWQAEKKVLPHTLTDERQATDTLHQLLRESVSRRLIADVPAGTFLSGGIDSSTVTALAREAASAPIRTFSIGFKEARFDERVWAEKVANHLQTEHHSFLLTEADALEQVSRLPTIYGQPYADSSAIPTLLVSQMARRQVTVALSGDGGDELFMGYGMHRWAQRLSGPAGYKPVRALLSGVLANLPQNRARRVARLLQVPAHHPKAHLFSQEQYFFSAAELDALLVRPLQKAEWTQTLPAEAFPLPRTLRPDEAQAFYDLKHYLKDDLLVKVDIASMFHALEVRVPLLDYTVVEFCLNLAPELKYRPGQSKYLLRQVLHRYVPPAFFERPKWGFGVPMGRWLQTDLRPMVAHYLSPDLIAAHGVVQPAAVRQLLDAFHSGRDYLYNRVWALLVLHKWLEEQGEKL